MKKIFFLAVSTLISIAALSQSKSSGYSSASLGLEVGMPMGDFKETHSIGLGASVHGLFGVKSGFTTSIGYMTFTGKDVNFGGLGTIKLPAFNMIPVKIGYRVATEGGFYFEPQIGITFTSSNGSSSSAFTYAPTIGATAGAMDVSVRYEGLSKDNSTLNFLGLRLAFKF